MMGTRGEHEGAVEELLTLAGAAARAAAPDELLAILLRGRELYFAGLAEAEALARSRYGVLENRELQAMCREEGVTYGVVMPRAEALAALGYAEWRRTPAALAFVGIAEHAAREGVCVVPDQR
ncbi:hypothetical protein [Streptomyces nanshensis]|nr:hypothetical protein [Streptomyces nanshensis]